MKVYSSSDFAKLRVSGNWAVERLVPGYGINVLYADAKVGKTILSMQLAKALTEHTPFLDRKVTGGPWKVLYIQADMPELDWNEQMNAYPMLHNNIWQTVIPDTTLPMLNPKTFDELKQIASGFNFIIIDSWWTMFGPDLKNTYLANCFEKLKKFHPGPLWIVHHKRHGPAGIPDENALAGGFVFQASASVLYDLNKTRIHAKGRIVHAEVGLQRTPDGLWEVDSSYQATYCP